MCDAMCNQIDENRITSNILVEVTQRTSKIK